MNIVLSLRELVVVCVIALVVFRVAKPIASPFIDPNDFSRRRNTWFALTATAFLAPNFWVFALVAIPLAMWAGRKDSNACAVYLMLFQVIPPIDVPVPMLGMSYLFSANMFLLLSFCVLTPLALRIYRSRGEHKEHALQFVDYCLLAYGLLTAILYLHDVGRDGRLDPGSLTDSMRRGFVFLFDSFIPYYAVSRAGTDRRKLTDMIATYCLCCALLAAIALFETLKPWLLYIEVAGHLGGGQGDMYLMRGGSLRAMASTGHAMSLAHLLVLAYGLWLYLQTRLDSRWWRIGGVVLFWSGLYAAFTRGAFISAIVAYFLFAALQPRRLSKVFAAAGAALIVGTLIYLSPLGDKIISQTPWLSGKEDSNLTYRELLWDRSWQITQESPLLGDQGAMLKMQDLRQGEGIVDLVNTYAGILLSAGFVGLALFLAFFLTPLFKAWMGNRRTMYSDQDLCLMGAGLVASLIATLILFWDGGFIRGPARMFCVFAGLATGYSALARSSPRDQPTVETVTASR
jgi:O-antigen ligase